MGENNSAYPVPRDTIVRFKCNNTCKSTFKVVWQYLDLNNHFQLFWKLSESFFISPYKASLYVTLNLSTELGTWYVFHKHLLTNKLPLRSYFQICWPRICLTIIPVTVFYAEVVFYKGTINETFFLYISNPAHSKDIKDINSQNLSLEHLILEDKHLCLTIWATF